MPGQMREGRAVEKSTQAFIDIIALAEDPAYEQAARRTPPGASGDSRRARSARGSALACVAALGLVLGLAAWQTGQRAPATARLRDALLDEVSARTRSTDALQAATAQLRRDVTAARDRGLRLTATGQSLARDVAALELAAAQVPVTGPGLVVVLTDPPAENGPDARITDRDVQSVVNALWATGAEAVGVGDERIGPLTAIREAGGVVLVDYRPVRSPYRVVAIGDPDRLEPGFALSAAAARLRTLGSAFGSGLSVARESRLELGAALAMPLRAAEQVAPPAAGKPATPRPTRSGR